MTAPVQSGDLLAGKYRVEKVLGIGGMGVVVSATHLQLDQLVALKFMLPAVLGNPEAVSRFLREARAAVRLKGEHVARVLDVGTLENGAPYIVMEYLDGDDLHGTLTKRGALSVTEAVGYVLQACEAMAEAHAQAIVHRDLKPQNLFLTTRPDGTPCVKVLDFGISKAGFAGDVTHTAAIMGSPSYMSPEQLKSSKDVDPRTDLWALGVILYQLVSGRLPFNADTMAELVVQVLHDEPPPLSTLRAGVPPAFEAVIARCLVKDREQRYANIAELVADLASFAPSGPDALVRVSRLLKVVPRPATVPSVRLGPGATTFVSGPGPTTTLGGAAGDVSISATRSTSRRGLAVAIAGVVVVAGVLVFVMTRSSDPAPSAQPAAETKPAAVVEPEAAVVVPAAPDAGVVAADAAPAAAVVVEAKTSRRVKDKKPAKVAPAPAVVETKPPEVKVEPAKPDPEPVKPAPEPDPVKPNPYGKRH